MGAALPPLYGENKKSKFYNKKIEKANNQILKWQQIKKVCEFENSKNK